MTAKPAAITLPTVELARLSGRVWELAGRVDALAESTESVVGLAQRALRLVESLYAERKQDRACIAILSLRLAGLETAQTTSSPPRCLCGQRTQDTRLTERTV